MESERASKSWPPELAAAFTKMEEEFWAADENNRHYDYADRFRECRIGNVVEEEAFRKIEEQGCCGSFEVEWELAGVKVRYGFNYGH